MPSRARKNFYGYPRRDVLALIRMYRDMHPGPGRPSSILTRSGTFLLCAAWELYCEEAALQVAIDNILWAADTPLKLPKAPRQMLATAVKNDKHELAALKLAGTGWKILFTDLVNKRVDELNTPSCEKVVDLFADLCGVDLSDILGPVDEYLTRFILKRGEIAHRGANAGHVSIVDLEADYQFISRMVCEVDNALVNKVRVITRARPWNVQAQAVE